MTPTKDQQAQEYAEKKTAAAFDYISPNIDTAENLKIPVFTGEQIKQAYLDGYTAAEQSMWHSVEEALPEEKKVVLCFMPDMKDSYAENDAYFDIAILLEGEFINLDAETIHPTHWMQITPPHSPTQTQRRNE